MVMHCRRDQRNLVAAALREVFNAENRADARERVGHVLERLAGVAPKVCELLEAAEEDLIAFYQLPSEHWTNSASTGADQQATARVPHRRGRLAAVTGWQPWPRWPACLVAFQTGGVAQPNRGEGLAAQIRETRQHQPGTGLPLGRE